MEFFDLPIYIQNAINRTLSEKPYNNGEYAKGKCIKASDHLIDHCDEILGYECPDGYVEGTQNFNGNGPHHWAVIEGFCIDLTARQFDEHEPCPKIWKYEKQPVNQ